MDKNKLERHDLYKPVFLIRLEDLDPARHHLLFECYGCRLVEDADIPALIEKEGSANRSIRSIAEWEGCKKCGLKPRDFAVVMREGVARRPLEEVRPNERRPLLSPSRSRQ